ncbi:MAG: alpha/beta fold hydrolase [Pseudomonadota bacterium]
MLALGACLFLVFPLGAATATFVAAETTDATPLALYRDMQAAQRAGRFADAEHLLEQTIAAWTRTHPRDLKNQATLHDKLASLRKRRGAYGAAEKSYRESLRLARQSDGAQGRTVGMTLHNLALLYSAQARYAEAQKTFEESRTILEARLDAGDPILSSLYVNLAYVHTSLGRHREAEALYKKGIAITERTRGGNDAKLGGQLNDLALFYDNRGRRAEAERLYRRSIRIAERQSPTNAVSLARRLNNLAVLLSGTKRHEEALPLFRRAIDLGRQSLGPRHTEVAAFLGNHALALDGAGRFETAEAAYRQSLAIMEAEHGRRHVFTAKALGHLASFMLRKDDYDAAIAMHKRALAIYRAARGPSHVSTALTLNNLSYARYLKGDLELAERDHRAARDIALRTLGPDHTDTQKILGNGVLIYEKLGRKDQVDALGKRLDVAAPSGTRNVTLFVATNRKSTDGRRTFGAQQADTLTFLRALIRVPKSSVDQRADRLVNASGLVARAERGTLTKVENLRLVQQTPYTSARSFADEAGRAAQRGVNFQRRTLLFVHGFNTDYGEALQRATQLKFDLEFDGSLVVFTWPSAGRASLGGYTSDQRIAARSVDALVKVIDTLAGRGDPRRLHFVAHSMGNQVLLRALAKIAARPATGTTSGPQKFGEVIAAHPDVSVADFDQLTRSIRQRVSGTTLYLNRGDLALTVSSALRVGAARAGNRVRGYAAADAIDTTSMNIDSSLNHDVFVRDARLFADMTRVLMRGTRPPEKRSPTLRAVTAKPGETYWTFTPAKPMAKVRQHNWAGQVWDNATRR